MANKFQICFKFWLKIFVRNVYLTEIFLLLDLKLFVSMPLSMIWRRGSSAPSVHFQIIPSRMRVLICLKDRLDQWAETSCVCLAVFSLKRIQWEPLKSRLVLPLCPNPKTKKKTSTKIFLMNRGVFSQHDRILFAVPNSDMVLPVGMLVLFSSISYDHNDLTSIKAMGCCIFPCLNSRQ